MSTPAMNTRAAKARSAAQMQNGEDAKLPPQKKKAKQGKRKADGDTMPPALTEAVLCTGLLVEHICGFLDVETLMMGPRHVNSCFWRSSGPALIQRLVMGNGRNKKSEVKILLWKGRTDIYDGTISPEWNSINHGCPDHDTLSSISIAAVPKYLSRDDHVEVAVQRCAKNFRAGYSGIDRRLVRENEDTERYELDEDAVRQALNVRGIVETEMIETLEEGWFDMRIRFSDLQEREWQPWPPNKLPLRIRDNKEFLQCINKAMGEDEADHFVGHDFVNRKRLQLLAMERCIQACLRMAATDDKSNSMRLMSMTDLKLDHVLCACAIDTGFVEHKLQFTVLFKGENYVMECNLRKKVDAFALPEDPSELHEMEFDVLSSI